VYADTDVLALGAVPDDPDSVPTALRGAHIGIHTWYHDREGIGHLREYVIHREVAVQ